MKIKAIIFTLCLCLGTTVFAQEREAEKEEMKEQREERMEQSEEMEDEKRKKEGDMEEYKKLEADAKKAKKSFIDANADLKQHLDNAAGYVVFPNLGKGALIIGVSAGNGVVYSNDQMVGYADIKKLDVGLQAGGKAFSELIIFKTEDAFEEFKNDEFEFSAGASAVVLKSGAAVNAKYEEGVAVFALPKGGLMAEAAVGGQKFDYKPIN